VARSDCSEPEIDWHLDVVVFETEGEGSHGSANGFSGSAIAAAENAGTLYSKHSFPQFSPFQPNRPTELKHRSPLKAIHPWLSVAVDVANELSTHVLPPIAHLSLGSRIPIFDSDVWALAPCFRPTHGVGQPHFSSTFFPHISSRYIKFIKQDINLSH
jgi:hypothetical protein